MREQARYPAPEGAGLRGQTAWINNLKTASARRCGARYREHLAGFYRKPAFWHRAYFVCSVGGVTLDVVKQYVQNQGTTDKPGRRPKPVETLARHESLVR